MSSLWCFDAQVTQVKSFNRISKTAGLWAVVEEKIDDGSEAPAAAAAL
jgi:hypothetical protein